MPRTILMLAMLALGLPIAAIAVRVLALSATSSLVVPVGRRGGGDQPPPILDQQSDAEPKEEAIEKKWLIVKTKSAAFDGGSWMEAMTWRDRRVVKWLDEHAVVATIDIDTDKPTVQALSLQGPPMIIACKDDKEFDRVVGSKTPSEFLEWLDGLERGERSIELYVQRPTTAELASEVDGVPARMLVVRTLTRSGLFTQAADECIQAWNVMRNWEPTMTGARTAPVAREAKELVAQSSAARQKFVALRDSMGERLDGDKVVAHDLINWIALNRVLNDNAATIDWFDRVKKDRHKRPLIYRVSFMIDNLLIARGRWTDLVPATPTPIERLEVLHDGACSWAMFSTSGKTGSMDVQRVGDLLQQINQAEVGKTYAGLLASSDENLAGAFASNAQVYFESESIRASMVRWALRANEPRRVHIEWLSADPNDEDAATLRKDVERALKKKQDDLFRIGC